MRFLSSVKSLYAAVGILFLTLVIGIYVDNRNETMNIRHREINIGLERMIRLNQELTNMLLISVLERNALRAASYDSVNTDLEETIKTVTNLTKMQNMLQEISALSEGHGTLHAMEENVIKLMSADKWNEARSILFGNEYVLAKKTYEIDSEVAVSAVVGELTAAAQRFRRINMVALGMRIGALLLLMGVGIMFSRRTQADFAEQVRLRDEITTAYEAMEERVRERTEELRLLLQSAGEGMFGVDTGGRLTFINPVALNLLGFTEEEMIGQEVHGLIHHSHEDASHYPQEDCPIFATWTQGIQRHATDEVLWRKDGRSIPVEYTSTPILQSGKVGGAVITFRDITELKKAEKELQERMEDLEQFNLLTINREEKMIQLKEEINKLLEQTGQERKYKIAE